MVAKHTTPLERLLVDSAFDGNIAAHEPMAAHTTYRIGGPARYFVRVDSLGALMQLVKAAKECGMPWMMAGRGSNLLVSDKGYNGLVITLGRDFRSFNADDERNTIMAGAGVPLSAIVQHAFRNSLAGLEFAVGTPGNIGGAIRMNAGSAREYIGEKVVSVTVFSPDSGMRRLAANEIEWSYRRTSFSPEDVVLECEIALEPADPFYIRGKMEANLAARKKAQPLNLPSCGSVFKNPEGLSAGKLIEDAGLKGAMHGGAQISDMHANFIVNKGGATAGDVLFLIDEARAKVWDAYAVELEPEVRLIGF